MHKPASRSAWNATKLIHNKVKTLKSSDEPVIQQECQKKRKVQTTNTVKLPYSISLITWRWNIVVSWLIMWQFGLQNWDIHPIKSQVIITMFKCMFPHQIRDVLLEFGNIKEYLAVHPNLQTQVVAGGVYLMGLEAKETGGQWRKRHGKWQKLKQTFRHSLFQSKT